MYHVNVFMHECNRMFKSTPFKLLLNINLSIIKLISFGKMIINWKDWGWMNPILIPWKYCGSLLRFKHKVHLLYKFFILYVSQFKEKQILYITWMAQYKFTNGKTNIMVFFRLIMSGRCYDQLHIHEGFCQSIP
jgi:hypothetical protein